MLMGFLNCFWMGFLLFLPAYMQSPGGIMVMRSVEVTGALRRRQNVNFTWKVVNTANIILIAAYFKKKTKITSLVPDAEKRLQLNVNSS